MELKEEESAVETLRLVLQAHGVDQALKLLNHRTDYRFTAIYRLEPGLVRNMHLYDREGIGLPQLSTVQLEDSFCQYVLADRFFSTTDSAGDGRLDGHPYQGVVQSYVGLPLSAAPGTLYGTFCHFDFVARELPPPELAFLEQAMALFMPYLDVYEPAARY